MANTELDLETLAKLMVKELQMAIPQVISGTRLPTFDISAVANCCEGHCPCDSRNGGDCPCNSRCACDGKVAVRDELDWVSQLAQLPQEQIKNVLEAVPIIQKVRLTKRVSEELRKK